MCPQNGMVFPILDNHMHLDPKGHHIEAVKRFQNKGGTHVIISHKPYEDLPVKKCEDYRTAYDQTIELVNRVNKNTSVKAYATLGPYPVELIRLLEKQDLKDAKEIMLKGMEIAKEYVVEGKAVGIGEIGRPHFPVDNEIFDASNEIMAYGMKLAAEAGCPVILHTESPNSDDHIQGILALSKDSGISPEMIIKHFCPPKLADPSINRGVTPSIVARGKSVKKAKKLSDYFLLETDYIDVLSRPDAVLPPDTIPIITYELYENGIFSEEDILRINKDIPEKIYHIDI